MVKPESIQSIPSFLSWLRPLVVAACALFISACSVNPEDYAGQTPALELPQFFNGPLKAYGVVEGPTGKVTRRFTAHLEGRWQGDQGVLDEHFVFDDGEESYRCWRITKDGNRYIGTAGDVVGQASGEVVGNSLNWQYYLTVPVDGEPWTFYLDDWLHLITEDHLINRTAMKKWGVTVAELSLYIGKVDQSQQRDLRSSCQL
ncbi:MAG: DUF3833 domain-containing protein [Pontibacterium sp.]